MPKKFLAWLAGTLFILAFFVACGFLEGKNATSPEGVDSALETQANMRKTVLYFVNQQNLLVPVTKDIPWVEGIGRAALENLVFTEERGKELEDQGLKPPLPEGTRVLGLTIREGLAKVDFSHEFLNLKDRIEEENAIKAVVYTLTEFPTVERVHFMVEGKPLKKCPNGTTLEDEVKREKINLEDQKAGGDNVPVTLYFRASSSDGTFSYFVPVTRMVEKSDDMMRVALEELIKGPKKEMGLTSVLPADTKVISLTQSGGEVIVNFSKEIEGYGGGVESEQALVDSIVLTLSEFPGVEKVTLQVEGESGVLPEGTMLDAPILKPAYINPDFI